MRGLYLSDPAQRGLSRLDGHRGNMLVLHFVHCALSMSGLYERGSTLGLTTLQLSIPPKVWYPNHCGALSTSSTTETFGVSCSTLRHNPTILTIPRGLDYMTSLTFMCYFKLVL